MARRTMMISSDQRPLLKVVLVAVSVSRREEYPFRNQHLYLSQVFRDKLCLYQDKVWYQLLLDKPLYQDKCPLSP